MSKEDRHVAETIYSIAHKGEKRGTRFPIMSGKVQYIDVDKGVCTVNTSIDDDDADGTKGITLSAVSMNSNGFILYPETGSNVVIGEVDGPGKWCILKCSNLTKAVSKVEDATITQTADGFNIKVGTKDLKTVMNNILNHIMQLTVPTPAGTSSVPVNIADFNTDLTDINSILT